MPFSAMAATASMKFAVTFSGSRNHAVNSIQRRMQLAWTCRASATSSRIFAPS